MNGAVMVDVVLTLKDKLTMVAIYLVLEAHVGLAAHLVVVDGRV